MARKTFKEFLKGLFKRERKQRDTSVPTSGDLEALNEKAMVKENQYVNGLPREFQYLQQLIHYRMGQFLPTGKKDKEPELPAWEDWTLIVPENIKQASLNDQEITLVLLALAPHIIPDLLDTAIELHLGDRGDFPKIGGVRGTHFRGFIPTGETALFLLAGDHLGERF